MKVLKIIALILLPTIFITACSAGNAEKLSANAAETSQIEETTTNVSDNIDTDTVTEPEIVENGKIFEWTSYRSLSEAEQIYKSIYNFTDFINYTTFNVGNDIDRDDRIAVETLILPYAELSKEKIGKSRFEYYFRITNGRLSDGVDFAMWLDSFASSKYISDFSNSLNGKFAVSEGKIYASMNIIDYYGGWLVTDDFTLDSITKLNNNTIQIDFSFTDYGIDIGSMPEETEYLSIIMSNENRGWKIDSYSGSYVEIALINELIRNENSDLLEQIENYLSENPLA